jgi:hypothetical protein
LASFGFGAEGDGMRIELARPDEQGLPLGVEVVQDLLRMKQVPLSLILSSAGFIAIQRFRKPPEN